MDKSSNDTLKFWTFLTICLLAVAVAVTLIDLTIKASILAESNAMKLRLEEFEVNHGQEIYGRIDQGNSANGSVNGHLPGNVLATDDAGLETGSADDVTEITPRARTRKRNTPSVED